MKKKILAALALAGIVGSTPADAAGPGRPGDQSIVEIALAVNAAEGEFSYLLGAVNCLTNPDGSNPVVDLLSGSDRYTLFAPNDAAFRALQTAIGVTTPSPEATCALGNETVFDVLAYHVTAGRRFANSVFNKNSPKTLEMLNGKSVTSNPTLTLTDIAAQSVPVVPPRVNVNAHNGVIHEIGAVLLPFVP